MAVDFRIDDLVQSVSLYSPQPILLHGTVLPFLVIYTSWLYTWFFIYGFDEFNEAGYLGIAVVGILQILSCLCCYWSVHIQCFLTCTKVRYYSKFITNSFDILAYFTYIFPPTVGLFSAL